jgi:chemotaxis protein MotB
MAGKGKKRGPAGDHENHERWLLTYADMITLLVAFFIMLYAMSVMNITKFQQLAVSVRSGFGSSMTNGVPTIMKIGGGINANPSIVSDSAAQPCTAQSANKAVDGNPPSWDVPSKALAATEEQKRLESVYRILKNYIAKKGLQGSVGVVLNERGVVITLLTDKMLFDSGKADLQPGEFGLLNTIAYVLIKGIDNPIRIEGHTDSQPIHTDRFPSNWELSAVRSATVLRYIAARGIPESRFEEEGYADQRPVASNDTAQGRRRNRRVEIVILRKFTS